MDILVCVGVLSGVGTMTTSPVHEFPGCASLLSNAQLERYQMKDVLIPKALMGRSEDSVWAPVPQDWEPRYAGLGVSGKSLGARGWRTAGSRS